MSVHSREITNKINHLPERVLRMIYDDYKSFQQLLNKDISVTIHQPNSLSLQFNQKIIL